MFPVDPSYEALLEDPIFLLRLCKRVIYGLVQVRPGNPSRTVLHSFTAVDRSPIAAAQHVVDGTALLSVVQPIFPVTLLTEKEVRILLHLLPLGQSDGEEAEGEERAGAARPYHGYQVDSLYSASNNDQLLDQRYYPFQVMRALREMMPFPIWVLQGIIETVRGTVSTLSQMTPFEEHVVDLMNWERLKNNKQPHQSSDPPPPLHQSEALIFFEKVCGLSDSAAEMLLSYCATTDGGGKLFFRAARDGDQMSKGSRGAVLQIDVRLLYQLLFSDVIPGVAEYPLLAGRFAESTICVGGPEASGPTGSLALLQALSSVELINATRGSGAIPDLDFGSIVEAFVTPRQFFNICVQLRTGFQQRESDQLYYYLKDDRLDTDGVLVRDMVQAYRQYFPAVSMSRLQLVQAATIQLLRRNSKDQLVFVRLYESLSEWGTNYISIEAFIASLRKAGAVPSGIGGVLDVELEWLRLKAPTRVDLLLMLCTPVPSSRAAVIRKLFERLDVKNEDHVEASYIMKRFCPEQVDGESIRRQVVLWKPALERYLDEVGAAQLDYNLFAYWWYMVSAGIEDDPIFTMVVWQAFGLANGGGRGSSRY